MPIFNHGLPIKANVIQGEGGTDTSKDTVTPETLLEGVTAHNAAGQEITGTIPDYSGGNTVEMTSPEGATLNTAGTYCEGNIEVVPKLQSKVATTGEVVTADNGYVGLESVDTNPAFEAGKKSEYDAFWDVFQENGNRAMYRYAFTRPGWTNATFKPKYDLVPIEANSMFWETRIYDLAKALNDSGVKLDLSQATVLTNCFGGCQSGTYPVVSTISASDCGALFAYSRAITIELILKDDGSQKVNMFDHCCTLTNLTIEGTIGQNGFSVSWSPLSKASIISVINALSSTTTGLTVTLRLDAVKKAFETTAGAADGSTSEEWTALIATKPNWTINLINS